MFGSKPENKDKKDVVEDKKPQGRIIYAMAVVKFEDGWAPVEFKIQGNVVLEQKKLFAPDVKMIANEKFRVEAGLRINDPELNSKLS